MKSKKSPPKELLIFTFFGSSRRIVSKLNPVRVEKERRTPKNPKIGGIKHYGKG